MYCQYEESRTCAGVRVRAMCGVAVHLGEEGVNLVIL